MPEVKKLRVKVPLGMRKSYFAPITEEKANAHPTYGSPLDMGAAVKGYLSITTMSGEIAGDDITQLRFENFQGAQLDAETTCSDLELNATVYGHKYTDGLETSTIDDNPPNGGYAFVEPILGEDKKLLYRATFLYKTSAIPSSEKTEADTRKSDFNPKYNSMSLAVGADNTGAWRARKEFDSMQGAEDFISSLIAGTDPGAPSSQTA